jgi:putative FmdB family regulatory protein
MPVYDYECGDCGVFTEMRAMSFSDTPCDCPSCGASSPRAFLSTPAVLGMDGARRKAHAANEESRHRPKTRDEYAAAKANRHPVGCGCCSGAKKSGVFRADGAKTFPSKRPWMISH